MRTSALGGALILTAATVTVLSGPDAGAALRPHPVAMSQVGHATVTSVKTVVLRKLPTTKPTQTVKQPGPLTIKGVPTYKAFSKTSPATTTKTATRSGPDVNGHVQTTGPKVTTPATITRNWDGLNLTNGNCNCQPPDVNAAAGTTQTVEAVNLSVAVYSKANPPALVKNTALSTFLGDSRPLSDPRVKWDPNWKRFVLTAIPIPTSTSSAPGLDLAVSKTASGSGAWFVYHISFGGGAFPAGTLLDYPMLGQQQDALVFGTNNFQLNSAGAFNYIGSTAFAVPKARAYNGLGFSFGAFTVAFSTHPAETGNIPSDSDGNAYLLAADNANQRMDLYKMTDAATPNTTALTLIGTPALSWSPPSRGAHQPGGAPDVDTLDGRIQAAPVVVNGGVWFAHGVNVAGFPAVQYGVVPVSAASVTVANAFHSGASDDFNPSIGVFPSGSLDFIYLNWAYTDAGSGIPVTDVFSGVSPGDGVPSLVGLDHQLVSGGTSGETRFGDFSSVSIAPYAKSSSCGLGKTAIVAQQYFSGGVWATRLAQVGFC